MVILQFTIIEKKDAFSLSGPFQHVTVPQTHVMSSGTRGLWEWLPVPQGGLCSPQEWQDACWPALCLAPTALHLATLQHLHVWE